MHTTVKSLLSLATVACASLVLLADSTDECEKMLGFDVTADYTTDCMASDQGAIHMSMPASAKSRAEAQDIEVDSLSGALLFSVSEYDLYTAGECSGGRGTGSVSKFDLQLRRTSQDTAGYLCESVVLGSKSQTVQCKQQPPDGGFPSPSASSCSLTLTMR